MKAIEHNISRHENGTLYLRVKREGKILKKSLKTKDLKEARKKIADEGILSFSSSPSEPPLFEPKTAREPSVPLLGAGGESVVVSAPAACGLSVGEALDEHREGLVLVAEGTKVMADNQKAVIARYCKHWVDFNPARIWNKYRASGKNRKGNKRELTAAANHLRWYLRKFVPWAVRRGYLDAEAGEKLKEIPVIKVNSRQIRVPAVSVVQEFLAMVASEDPDGGDFAKFLATTGLRITGARSLRWQDLDLERGTMSPLQKGGARKVIPMTREAIALVNARLGKKALWDFDDAAIERLRKRIKRFAKGYEIDLTNFHSFRHYFASRCLIEGFTVQEVAKLLGHSDQGQLVLKTYGHLCPDHMRDALSRLSLAS